jgi:alkylhydroperoxidase family enzyme
VTRGVRVPTGADGRPTGRDTELAALLSAYQDAVVRSRHLDPVVTELVRLRCARQHDCRICQTLRLADAARAGVDAQMTDQIDHYESSDLSERQKTALRIVDAFIWRPTEMSDELVEQAHAHLTDAELAELLVDITKWSTQKVHVTLGTDGIDRLPVGDAGVAYFGFDSGGRVAGYSESPADVTGS